MFFRDISSAVSIAFGVTGGILAYLAYFRPRRVRSRRAKLVLLAVLIFVSITLVVIELTSSTSTPVAVTPLGTANAPAVTRNDQPQNQTKSPDPVVINSRSDYSKRTVHEASPAEALSDRTVKRTIRVVDEHNEPIAELLVAAQNLNEALSLTAHLKTSVSDPDEHLQGLITTHTTLQVSVTHDGRLIDAFTLQSTGGGFTQDASTQQARERLALTLTQRLEQEHP